MIKLASDENFDGDIVRGLLRRVPELDLVRVQDADPAGSPDPVILAWAASSTVSGPNAAELVSVA